MSGDLQRDARPSDSNLNGEGSSPLFTAAKRERRGSLCSCELREGAALPGAQGSRLLLHFGLQDALCPLQHLCLQVVFSILCLHVLCISDSLDWMHGHAGTEKSHSTVYSVPLLAITPFPSHSQPHPTCDFHSLSSLALPNLQNWIQC